jgi:zinc/manganese transport system substrate-binding protein
MIRVHPDRRTSGMLRFPLLSAIALLLAQVPAHAASPISVVAAENFYGDVAQQIGGPEIAVKSILSNPDEDPHLFEASPSVARAVSVARIVIYNGIDYDPWMGKLVRTAGLGDRKAIVVAELLGKKTGDNPHIWYDPKTMPVLAEALARALGRASPAHRAEFRDRLMRFQQSLRPLEAKIAALRTRLAGIPATATEPVFGYMLAALGMPSRNQRFQMAVMNNTDPSPSEVAAFEDDLKNRRVRMLVFNSQASDPVALRMMRIAEAAQVPVIGVTETEPPGRNYQAWMLSQLDAVDKALSKVRP